LEKPPRRDFAVGDQQVR